MEFGRVQNIEGIDLCLPPDHPDTSTVLGPDGHGAQSLGKLESGELKSEASGAPIGPGGTGMGLRVSVGLPAWNDRGIARRICPKGTPEQRRLECYSRLYNAIELNSSGYALSASNASVWAARTPHGFLFYPKVPRTITHGGDLVRAGGLFREFCAAAAAFGDRLGICLLQFPEEFGPSRLRELEAFLRAHAGSLPLAVEVRHRGWFANAAAREAYFGLLAELRMCAVIVDVPGRRDLLHQRLTVPHALIRFSGHDRSPRDRARLDDWVSRLKAWTGLGLRRAGFFLHHVPDSVSVDWASDFVEGMNRVLGLDMEVPRLPEEMEPQLDLFGAP